MSGGPESSPSSPPKAPRDRARDASCSACRSSAGRCSRRGAPASRASSWPDAPPAAGRRARGRGRRARRRAPRRAPRPALEPRHRVEGAARRSPEGAATVGVAGRLPATTFRAPNASCSRALIKDTEGFMSRHFDRHDLARGQPPPRRHARDAEPDDARRASAIGVVGAPFFLSSPPGRPGRGRAPLPPALDPRRLRRRARAAEVPGVALRRHAGFLGRQRRPHGGLRCDGTRLAPRDGPGLAALVRTRRPCSRRWLRPGSSTGGR